MGFGIHPKHNLEIPFDTLSVQEFLVVAIEAAQTCHWQITFISAAGFKAITLPSAVSSGEEITCRLQETNASLTSESKGRKLYNNGQNKKNLDEFFSHFFRLRDSTEQYTLHPKYEALREKFNQDEDLPVSEQNKQWRFDLLRIFIPVEGYFITPILINLNILILLLMIIISGANPLLPDNDVMLKWGADFKPYTLNGEWWRMVSANFLHFGLIHLFFNMNALLYIGVILEPLLGRTRFFLAYFLTGLTSSIGSLWWHDFSVSAGASGSIFGMYGVFFALLTTNFIDKESRSSTLKSIGLFVVYNLVFGAAAGADNAGHIGGLLGGLFLGYCFYFLLRNPQSRAFRILVPVFVTTVICSLSVLACFFLSDPVSAYQTKLNTFVENEKKAMEHYQHLSSDTTASIGHLKQSLTLWNENTALMKEIDALNLPETFEHRNILLLRYSTLRQKFFGALLEKFQHPPGADKQELEEYNSQIEAVLEQINTAFKSNE